MKKTLLLLSILVITALACNLGNFTGQSTIPPTLPPVASVQAGEPSTAAPTEAPTQAPTVQLPAFEGTPVSFDRLSLVLPPGLAQGITGTQFPLADSPDLAYWDLDPGHIQVDLDGYLLQGKFHQPRFYVYPAQGYAELFTGASESIQRLQNILANPGTAITEDQLPTVPFFNAAQVFATNIQIISFQNGQGVRFLTQYAQFGPPANNQDLFYEFQGLTNDGAFYVIAILPATAPGLGESSDPNNSVPVAGVAYPGMSDSSDQWDNYYNAVRSLLNGTAPEAFSPTLNQLDNLVQSLVISQ